MRFWKNQRPWVKGAFFIGLSVGLLHCFKRFMSTMSAVVELKVDAKKVDGDGETLSKCQQPIHVVNIVYATEWGCCERLAERLAERMTHFPCTVRVMAIEDFHLLMADPEFASHVFNIFIGSTIGQGEPPNAALGFMKKLKRRELHIGYAMVVGVGHSNFETYNHFGIELHKKLSAQAQMLTDKPILVDTADPACETLFLNSVSLYFADILALVSECDARTVKANFEKQVVELVLSEPGEDARWWPVKDRGKPQRIGDKPLFDSEKAKIVDHAFASTANSRAAHMLTLVYPGVLDTTVGQAIRIWSPCSAEYYEFGSKLFGGRDMMARIVDERPAPQNGKFMLPKGVTLSDVVRYLIDWTAVPGEALMRAVLAEAQVQGGSSEVIAEVTRDRLTLYEFLAHVAVLVDATSRNFSLPVRFVLALPKSSPRAYTLASHVERNGTKSTTVRLFITESVTARQSFGGVVKREAVHLGRVSSWLQEMRMRPESAAKEVLVTTMRSICSTRQAVHGGVWCGAGSGCGLYRGFISDRLRTFQKLQKPISTGPHTCVYLSLRSRAEYNLLNSDSLFERAVANGLVAEINVFLTREEGCKVFRVGADGLLPVLSASAEKIYIGTSLRQQRPAALQWLVDGVDGFFIICGGAWLKESITSSLDADVLEKLTSTYRLVSEVW